MCGVLEHKLEVPADPLCSIDDVLKKLDVHVTNSSKGALQRKALFEGRQEGESFDDFWTRLKILLK